MITAFRGKPRRQAGDPITFAHMKKRSIVFHTVPAGLFAGMVLSFFLGPGTAHAQMITRTVKSSPVRPAPKPEKSGTNSRFAAAVSENLRLRTDLTWTFGGKTQSGWAIYEPLIADTVGSKSDATTPAFASSLASWQSAHGVMATGIIDETTLAALMKYWQSQRLGRSDFPGPEKLITAPLTDFYDPTRSPDLLQLERRTYVAYKRMIAAAARDLGREIRFTRSGDLAPGEKYFRIVSAFRSQEYQDQLRARSPGSGRAAIALHSAHNTGQALDLYVGGDPVSTKDPNRLLQTQTPVYKWLVRNAHKFGFYNYFYEPWHWEYVPSRDK
jgi:zinc D-Ala-D-Ala carboxypeptidase